MNDDIARNTGSEKSLKSVNNLPKRHSSETRARISAGVSKYRPIFCRQITEYFQSYINDADDDLIDDEGNPLPPKSKRQRRRGYPSYTKFAAKKGVTLRTLENWRRAYPEFGEACDECDAIQAEIIKEKGLTGEYQGNVVRLLLSAEHGCVEKSAASLQAEANINTRFTGEISESDRMLLMNLSKRLMGDRENDNRAEDKARD